MITDPNLVLYADLSKRDGSSFMSDDAYGHLCTVTGALWRPYGRLFDGINDRIISTTPSGMAFGTGDFTMLAWVYAEDYTNSGSENTWRWVDVDTPDHINSYGLLFTSDDNPTEANRRKMAFYCRGADDGYNTALTAVATKQTWYFLAGKRDGGDTFVSLDGASWAAGGTGADKSFSGVDTLAVGSQANAAAFFSYGKIGEVWVYGRALTAPEIQHNYLATKWKYR